MFYWTPFGDVYVGNHMNRRGIYRYIRKYCFWQVVWSVLAVVTTGLAVFLAILSWGMQ